MKKLMIILLSAAFLLLSACEKAINDENIAPYESTEPDMVYYESDTPDESTDFSQEKTTARLPETTAENTKTENAETTKMPSAVSAAPEVKTTKPPVTETEKKRNTVTISITCAEILENMDSLKKGKEYFVPSDGIILPSAQVEINDGDTAFDVLKTVCNKSGIQFEFSYSGGFGSYYIEGINQIYEKDCGVLSGWIYTVNGEYPSVGCSDYTLSNGDSVQFIYTCNG